MNGQIKPLATVEEIGALAVVLASGEVEALIAAIARPIDGGWTAH